MVRKIVNKNPYRNVDLDNPEAVKRKLIEKGVLRKDARRIVKKLIDPEDDKWNKK